MKRINYVSLALLAAACGGTDQTALSGDGLPRGVIRIDGDVERDHIFYDAEHRESYCAMSPESPVCSEIGSAEQAWISAEYHGHDDTPNSDIPCYASDSDRGDCVFPARKRIKYVFDTTNCFPTLNDATHDPVDPLDGSAMTEGTRQGMERWHNISTGVSVENNACSTGTCMTVNVSCTVILDSDVAKGGLISATTQAVSNLPSGPHGGVDQAAARTANGGTIRIDPGKILSWFRTTCDATPSRAQLRQVTRYIAAHEMGHVFGFEHFDEGADNIMFPFIDCGDTAAPVIATPFAQALGSFNPSGGNATVLDHNLETQGP